MTGLSPQSVALVRMVIVVSVDLTDPELIARISGSNGSLSIEDVVQNEAESHLGSVSYVRRASIIVSSKGGAK